jgi:two-component system response regulator FixJ
VSDPSITDLSLIIITGHGDVSLAVRAMKAGAVDFIEKPILSEAIQNSIDAALAQLTPPRGHDLLVTAAVARLGRLSPREHEVLERLLGGFPNKSIARDRLPQQFGEPPPSRHRQLRQFGIGL